MATTIWLRSESKPAERRTVLPPKHARVLVEAGYEVIVEQSSQSIFCHKEYEALGCRIVPEFSWKAQAPPDAIVLGLKELETSSEPLIHNHIHFAHVFKYQAGWENYLNRFRQGGGALYDLEFLLDESGRRVAAFGHWAGFAGAALAAIAYAHHLMERDLVLEAVTVRNNQAELIEEIRCLLQQSDRQPAALVIGARGRCGRGAVELLKLVGAHVTQWDVEETQNGGPFSEALEHDMFLNCVFVEQAIPPFINRELLESRTDRNLKVICDVSCDPYGDYNPIPIYDQCTTFQEPVIQLEFGSAPLSLIAIDHLPSLLPRESSEDFCDQLMPYLLRLDQLDQGVWGQAHDIFESKTALLNPKA